MTTGQQGLSCSDDECVYRSQEDQEYPVRSCESEPDIRIIKRFSRKRAFRLRKQWLRELETCLSPERRAVVKQHRRLSRNHKDFSDSLSYKYGRLAMIGLALFSIPIDGWKLYQGVGKTELAIDGPTPIEVFDYYSSAIATHVIGLAAAVDNNLILTIGCRLLSTILYQSSYETKGNSSVPTDPKELQKYIREKVPAHRLPKGYRFTDGDPITGKGGRSAKSKKGKRGSNNKQGKKKNNKKKKTDSKSKNQMNAKSATASKKHSAGKSSPGDNKKSKVVAKKEKIASKKSADP